MASPTQRWNFPRFFSVDAFDFWAGKLNPLWSLNTPLGLITDCHNNRHGRISLMLRVNRHCAPLGQLDKLFLGVEFGGRRHNILVDITHRSDPRHWHLSPVEAPQQDLARSLMPSVRKPVVTLRPAWQAPQSAIDVAQTLSVTLARRGRTVEIRRDLPLLGALEDAGENLAHGCRRGLCNSCACEKLAGITRSADEAGDDIEPGRIVRPYITRARSNLVLDI